MIGTTYHVICDNCGVEAHSSDDSRKSRQLARNAGWIHVHTNDYCKVCAVIYADLPPTYHEALLLLAEHARNTARRTENGKINSHVAATLVKRGLAKRVFGEDDTFVVYITRDGENYLKARELWTRT